MPESLARAHLSAGASQEFMTLVCESIVAANGKRKGERFIRELAARAGRLHSISSMRRLRSGPDAEAKRLSQIEAAEFAADVMPLLIACVPEE